MTGSTISVSTVATSRPPLKAMASGLQNTDPMRGIMPKIAARAVSMIGRKRSVAELIILSLIHIYFVSSYFNIKKQDLLGKKRKAQFAFPRQIAMYLCRDMINESYPQIAVAFSRDHTTILHAYDKITKEIERNEETKHIVAEIKQKLTTCG